MCAIENDGRRGIHAFFVSHLTSSDPVTCTLYANFNQMVMVSFVEILKKSHDSFVDAGFDDGKAFSLALLCFFGGVAFMEVRK